MRQGIVEDAVQDTVQDTSLFWFRNDLRLTDNPALSAAFAAGRPVLCVYVLDEESDGTRPLGGASRWWLHGSLTALQAALSAQGQRLLLRRGPAKEILLDLAQAANARAIFWTHRYTAGGRAIDDTIRREFEQRGLSVQSYNGNLLHEPCGLQTASGGPYRVFTPFWRAVRDRGMPRPVIPAPSLSESVALGLASDQLDDWRLVPRKPDWAAGLRACWEPGEAAAQKRLTGFLRDHLSGYAARRDRPDLDVTSRLSPHLAFGEISPVQIWHGVQAHLAACDDRAADDADKFLSELGWREFSHHLLFHFPSLPTGNFDPRFDIFPWRDGDDTLRKWQRGLTGYPIVDAGMRQLWQTGWMHNRVRMIAASFLIKHLLIDWRAGERWFWDTLVDADPANNAASWQWVAGSGADAAPYFRIFNPILQGQKFDPQGHYVRQFVPELADLPDKHVHTPWAAPEHILRDSGISPGRTYPAPIIDHKEARKRALAAFEVIKHR